MGNEVAMRLPLIGAASVLAVLASLPVPAESSNAGPPAAVLTSCRGAVTVVRAGSASPALFGHALHDGDEVKTSAGAEAEILFAAGNWVQVGPGSSMTIKGRPGGVPAGGPEGTGKPEGRGGSFEVVQNFLKLKNAEGSSAVGTLRSGDKPARLSAVSPCQTTVRTPLPTFRWTIDDPATELRLTVYGGSHVIWQADVSAAASASYPADAPALGPGVTYSWTLESTDPLVSPPLRTPASFFDLIAPADAKTLDTDLSQLDANKPGPVTYHLTRASLYFEHGLVDEAIVETQAALASDPDNASLRAILARLYAETGRTHDAITELERAQQ
jgi:hypothetical protein